MNSRLELQAMLEKLLGSRNVYFQPPSTLKMSYPAIVYSLDDIANTHANNIVYTQYDVYKITYIDKNPESPIVRKLSTLPRCTFLTWYPSDNLNHYRFKLYY